MKAKSQQSSKAATPSGSTRPSRGQNRPSRPCGRHWCRPRRLGCAQRLNGPIGAIHPIRKLTGPAETLRSGRKKTPAIGDINARPEAAPETQKLQKLLAQAGLGSRREMEELIIAGQATINGKVAQIRRPRGTGRCRTSGKAGHPFQIRQTLPSSHALSQAGG